MTTSPYGSWESPLTAAAASAGSLRLEGAAFVGDEIWWGEGIPAEGGRTAVRRRTAAGEIDEVLPSPWSARSRVHEYGGGSWTASPDGRLFFVERSDQRVWLLAPGDAPVPLTPDTDGLVRHGGLSWQADTLLAVREDHRGDGTPRRSIVAVPAQPGPATVELATGSDFVAQPALSPDGTRLAWVAWDHPDMPWDATRICTRVLNDGDTHAVTTGTTAALQPAWWGDDLVYIDDPTGRWNLYRTGRGALAPADADTGGGLWVLGLRWYALQDDGGVVAVRTHGSDRLVRISPDGHVTDLPVSATSRLVINATDGTRTLVSGTAPGTTGLWLVDGDAVTLVHSATIGLDEQWLPVARPMTVAGPRGPVHAFDYPPTNPLVTAADGERPPYVVFVHGGPTAHVGGVADTKTAYFTSRGIGVLDVNYGGSTGYGRAYRERLRGQWGVADVADVVAAARALAADGADAARIAIEGGSAGGWTVLGALVASDVFAAGISRYGVGDARMLAADTHDFEARYLDGLIGPLPEAEEVYRARSPLSHADRFRVPLLLLQGDEDAVVPPSQAEAIRDALAARGIPHAYVLYPGEGHGFRRAETIVHALESELAFLGAVFGFDAPGVPPIDLS
ncbi:S9 family peptidase [Microbacterium sp.]|uniref:S9 family peptidase n=1 Tax=Microbacterium sp. TaxID=51671 RepID=UPI003A8B4EFE